MEDMTPEQASEALKRVNSYDSGFLARNVRDQAQRERARAAEDLKKELEVRRRSICLNVN